jgi:uncharacterized OB-fold protein
MPQRRVAEGLFEWPSDAPRLVGSRCGACSQVTFPAQDACPRCGGGDVANVPLSTRGTLWTWTRQRFQPKNPPYAGREPASEFEPYGVGFIELPEGRIESRLAVGADGELHIGMPMELTIVPFAVDEDGDELMTYAFRPTDETPETPES